MRLIHYDRFDVMLDDLHPAGGVTRTRNVDGTDTIEFNTVQQVGQGDRIVLTDSMGRVREYMVSSIDESRASSRPVAKVTAVDAVNELAGVFVLDQRNRSANAKACLSKLLDGTRWTVGTVQNGTTTVSADLSVYHESAYDGLQDICDTYGLELETSYEPDASGTGIGRRVISLLESRGDPNATKRFSYAKDLTSIRRTITAEQPITRCYGYGKGVSTSSDEDEDTTGYGRKLTFADVNDGKEYIEDDDALKIYGIPDGDGGLRHVDGIYENGDCEDAIQLLEETRRYLAEHSKPTVSYEGDVISLGKAGYDAEGVDLGDSVQIVDTTFTPALRLEGRVLEIGEDLTGSLSDTTLTLGNIIETATERRKAQQQQLDGLINSSGAWSSAAAGIGSYVTDLIGRVNEIMNATGGYVYQTPGQGILIYDRPVDEQPTQAMQLGGGYWRIAHQRKADGDWDWRSLADGKGVYADVIYTGRLSDAAGLNYWDLDTGEFSLSSRATVGGSTVGDIAGTAADEALSAAKSYADTGDDGTLAAAKTYATSQAKSYVDTLDDALDQLEIFNRLTNNGRTQGIYMSGGLLYVNATYMKAGIIRGGSSYWNLDTGAFTTYSMTANSIKADGTFECGSTYKTKLDSTGKMVGYRNGSQVGYIDYSASAYNVDNPSEIFYGIQLQANGIVRISSPRLSTAASSSTSTTTTRGFTGTISQPVVSRITDNGNGTISWRYGTFQLRVINGLVTGYTTVSA